MAPMRVEEPRVGQELMVEPMGAQQGVQIMAEPRGTELLVADSHHKEVSGDALAADTKRKHHHKSFSVEEWERPPLGWEQHWIWSNV